MTVRNSRWVGEPGREELRPAPLGTRLAIAFVALVTATLVLTVRSHAVLADDGKSDANSAAVRSHDSSSGEGDGGGSGGDSGDGDHAAQGDSKAAANSANSASKSAGSANGSPSGATQGASNSANRAVISSCF